MQTVSWSVPNNPTSFLPSRPGTEFVCEACPCGSLELFTLGKTMICECPHIVQVIADGEVVEVHSLGSRH